MSFFYNAQKGRSRDIWHSMSNYESVDKLVLSLPSLICYIFLSTQGTPTFFSGLIINNPNLFRLNLNPLHVGGQKMSETIQQNWVKVFLNHPVLTVTCFNNTVSTFILYNFADYLEHCQVWIKTDIFIYVVSVLQLDVEGQFNSIQIYFSFQSIQTQHSYNGGMTT